LPRPVMLLVYQLMMLGPSDGAGYKGVLANDRRASVRRLVIGLDRRHDTGWVKHVGGNEN
jgi:hypothetical protein